MFLGRQVQEKPLLIGLQYKGWALLQCFSLLYIVRTLKQPTFWLLRIWIWLDYEQERNTSSYCNIQYIILVQQLSSREEWRNNDSDIWATAFICYDEDKMWRQAGFVEMLFSPAKRVQNEMGGLQKRGRFRTSLKRGHSWWKRGHSWWTSVLTWLFPYLCFPYLNCSCPVPVPSWTLPWSFLSLLDWSLFLVLHHCSFTVRSSISRFFYCSVSLLVVS